MDGGQTAVPCGHRVAPLPLKVVQESADGVGLQVVQSQRDTRFTMELGCKLQQELPCVAIGEDGMAAKSSLRDKLLFEKVPNQYSKINFFHGLWMMRQLEQQN